MRKIILNSALLFALSLFGCDVFPTRSPEAPVTISGNFEPATTSDIALDNFVNAINETEINNYEKCFSDKQKGHAQEFEFQASGSVLSLYPSVFFDWNFQTEIKTMKAIFSSVQAESSPVFVLSDKKYINYGIDSVSLSADYSFSITFTGGIEPEHYSGTLYLYFYKESDGCWYINRWSDIDNKGDSTSQTISYLKAKHYN